MPIEIRELVIKATIDDQTSKKEGETSTKQEIDKEEIVSDCVEQIMEILKKQKER